MTTPTTNTAFPFVANRLCLDFVNTEVLAGGRVEDLLGNFEGLLGWAEAAGLLTTAELRTLAGSWVGGNEASEAWEQARTLRRALRESAEQLAVGKPAPVTAVAQINELLRRRSGYTELVEVPGGYAKRHNARILQPADLLAPIAESAAELLSSDDPAMVRKCESPDCIIYFYDTTKNHRRRWCSMALCGNRAKVAAHYQRRRKTQGEGSKSGHK